MPALNHEKLTVYQMPAQLDVLRQRKFLKGISEVKALLARVVSMTAVMIRARAECPDEVHDKARDKARRIDLEQRQERCATAE